MNGAGNDFVCLDNRTGELRLSKKQIARLCHRQTGIGADGLLVLEKTKLRSADFRMRYYNSDGGEASMCGNGARCFARLIQRVTGWRKPSVRFQTGAGVIHAQYIGNNVRIQLTAPTDCALNQKIGNLIVHSINTGVPHAIVFVKNAENVDVREMGSALRWHETFAPKGTNVNFAQVLKKNSIRLRTYERGVEDETLACGTGVTATALIAHLIHGWKPPIRVRVQGGDTLVVNFQKLGDDFQNVTLLGPAEVTFKGVWD